MTGSGMPGWTTRSEPCPGHAWHLDAGPDLRHIRRRGRPRKVAALDKGTSMDRRLRSALIVALLVGTALWVRHQRDGDGDASARPAAAQAAPGAPVAPS